MRLFTGIAVPDPLIDNLARLLDRLRPSAHVHWCPVYNFHITTKFIGQWTPERLDELVEAVHPLGEKKAFAISIAGIGWFPNPHSPRVLWAGVKGGEALPDLARATDVAFQTLGIALENKPYAPHLTLARIRDSSVPLGPLRQAIAQLPSVDLGSFTADRFCLYESKPGPNGTIYTQLAEVPFRQQ